MLDNDIAFTDEPILAMPPRQSNRNFLEVYEVVFILDDREKFGFVPSLLHIFEKVIQFITRLPYAMFIIMTQVLVWLVLFTLLFLHTTLICDLTS